MYHDAPLGPQPPDEGGEQPGLAHRGHHAHVADEDGHVHLAHTCGVNSGNEAL